MENNIINFPKNKKFSSENVLTQEDVLINVASVKYNHVNETLAAVIPMLFSNIEIAGFDLSSFEDHEEDIMIKDGTFIVEAVRSILCKYHGIYHPFQDLAEQSLDRCDDDSFLITDSVNIVFKKDEKDSES
jgi:hypothetical protein